MSQTYESTIEEHGQRMPYTLIDYIQLLNSYGISNIEPVHYYYKIGNTLTTQGWMFHIPVWDIHFESLMNKILPYLLEHHIPFMIPTSIHIHLPLQAGAFGYKNLGKIISIFPNDNTTLLTLAQDLIALTAGYRGTPVPTDFHLGNIVYTRYGSYDVSTAQNDIYITDNLGIRIKDEETIPPIIYPWDNWPFTEIAPPLYSEMKKILDDKYLIKKVIKQDVKGRVLTALYQKNFFTLKKCIIKEGVKGMGVDLDGRDMPERLTWQQELYNRLKSTLPIPEIIDTFEDTNSVYIAFQYIKGHTFGNYLSQIYNYRSWYELQPTEKINILTFLLSIVEIIKKLHTAGYIHRDLNSENFLIDKRNKVWLLDLELSFDHSHNHPYPPYEKGTLGYMSPEQLQILTPTFEQDIYSIGAILLVGLTHILPEKIITENSYQLRKTIKHFNGLDETAEIISSCLNHEISHRPKIENIISSLQNMTTGIKNGITINTNYSINKNELEKLLKNATNTLTVPSMINVQEYWSSPLSTTDTFILNTRLDRTIYLGFRKGISGILHAIGHINKTTLNIDKLKPILQKNTEYISYIIQTESHSLQSGLLHDSYGIAMGLISLMKSNIIPANEDNQKLLILCLENFTEKLDLADGIAGYGITLLKCKDLLPQNFIQEKLTLCIKTISTNQLPNGAWKFNFETYKPAIITGFYHGMAGVIWFLLCYAEEYRDQNALSTGIKGLKYLLKIRKKINNATVWPVAYKHSEIHNFSNGGFNILLPFIKAYKLTNDPIYKSTVEEALNQYPQFPVSDIFNLERGLAGLGELYLDAYEVFKDEKWLHRAEWLASSLMHQSIEKDGYTYWLNNDPFYPHADLLTGQSGIIHFLARIWRPDLIPNIY